MSYTDIDKPTDYFETLIWTGNGSTPRTISGLDFAPNMIWSKRRDDAAGHNLLDIVRNAGANSELCPSSTGAEGSNAAETYGYLSAFTSDGFTVTAGSSDNAYWNNNSATYVAWNWLAGGSAPAITYSVKVVSDSGNKYRFDDFGTSAVTLDLQEGGTYTFDQSDSSNSGHPLRFSTTSDGSHGGGSEFTTNVTTTGTPGNAGAKTVITLGSGVATLYYYCTQHSGMGGQANTNSTFGSSNFSGSIQSTVSAGTTQGFSIVSFTGNGSSSATVGHGLNAVPKVVICKKRSGSGAFNWHMRHEDLTSNHNLWIDASDAEYDMTNEVNNGGLANLSSSSTFGFLSGVQNADAVNESSGTFIAYCFAEKKGYSKFGSYTGNGNADGVFVYTGFKPAFVFVKKTSGGQARNWCILDNKREGFNPENDQLHSNTTGAESMGSGSTGDLFSNGFKFRATDDDKNGSYPYIYMAFAESPFVTSTGIPTTAR
nr:hypothetical protein [uncultured Mediterranean phage uvMED]